MIKSRKTIYIFGVILALLGAVAGSFLFLEQIKANQQTVIVAKFRDGSDVDTVFSRNKFTVLEKLELAAKNTRIVVSTSDPKKVLEKFRQDPDVLSAGFEVTAVAIPNDPLYNEQWALTKISAQQAWDITTGSAEIKIAILDTGFALSHQDFAGKFVAGRDFVHNDADPSIGQDCPGACSPDFRTHGTLVAGIALAKTNNGIGVSGVNWESKIMPIQVMSDSGNSSTDQLSDGIKWATDNGARVINVSLGSTNDDSKLRAAVEYAYSKGVVIAASSGNAGNRGVIYPAAYPQVIAVGASDSSGKRANFSNYGPELDVLAPGVDVLTTYWTPSNETSGYAYGVGTSLAAPYVSGQASLILSNAPSLTNAQVIEIIRSGADKVEAMAGADFTEQYGMGVINLPRSLCTMGLTSNPRPNGVLIRDPATGKVYLLDKGSKLHIDSPISVTTQGFVLGKWIDVSSTELDAIPLGSPILIREGTLIKAHDSEKIYIIDADESGFKKRWVEDLATFNHWGFRGIQIVLVDNAEVAKYVDGPNLTQSSAVPDGMLLRNPSTGAVFVTYGGIKRWINSPAAFNSHAFKSEFVQNSETFLSTLVEGEQLNIRPGTLIKVSNRNEIYVVDINGSTRTKRWIVNPTALTVSGLSTKPLILISNEELETYVSASDIRC